MFEYNAINWSYIPNYYRTLYNLLQPLKTSYNLSKPLTTSCHLLWLFIANDIKTHINHLQLSMMIGYNQVITTRTGLGEPGRWPLRSLAEWRPGTSQRCGLGGWGFDGEINGGFLKWGNPKMDGLYGKSHEQWMIWGYMIKYLFSETKPGLI